MFEISLLAFFSIIFWGGVVFFTRWFRAINAASKQRKALIRFVFDQPHWEYYSKLLDEVDFDEHMWAIVWRRDPKLLYNDKLWPVFEQEIK